MLHRPSNGNLRHRDVLLFRKLFNSRETEHGTRNVLVDLLAYEEGSCLAPRTF